MPLNGRWLAGGGGGTGGIGAQGLIFLSGDLNSSKNKTDFELTIIIISISLIRNKLDRAIDGDVVEYSKPNGQMQRINEVRLLGCSVLFGYPLISENTQADE